MSEFTKLSEAVFKGDLAGVKSLTQELVNGGALPLDIINQGLIGGMNIVGPRFKAGEMFVPEVMLAARAMGAGMDILQPLIADGDVPSLGKIVIGTVKGDLHDIGKNLVVMILGSCGFNVIDLGVDVSTEQFVEAVKEHNPQIVGLSALLTTTMHVMKETLDALSEAGLRDSVKVIIGGAPVSESFADEIGADAYGADAMSTKDICEKMVS